MAPLMFINQFLRDMRSQKLRTLLTLFGIIWGTTAVTLLLAFGEGLHAQMRKSAHGLGDKIVIMWPGRTSRPYEGLGKGRFLHLKEEDVSLLKREIKQMGQISPEYSQWNIQIKYGKNIYSQNVVGVYPVFADMRNMIPVPGGRFINELDIKNRKRVVFLGNRLKKDLFREDEAVGKYVLINNTPFLVVGILKKKEQDSSYSSRDAYTAVIPATTLSAMFGRRYLNNMVFKPKDPTKNEYVKKRVYEVLGKKYRFDPEDKEALAMWDTTGMDKFFNYLFYGLRIFLGILGAFTLVVGGIGVSNIMNVVIEERTKEIGIKMATGAKKRFILSQFLFETLLITFMGGAIGFLFSWGIITIFPLFKLEEYIGTPVFSASVAISATLILGLIGILAGFFPARRAASLNPIEALRL
ncbi:MAG: ABC transporter permease [Candidatus Zixiibacteriota bacterium]